MKTISLVLLLAIGATAQDTKLACVPIDQASQFIGKTACIVGKVHHVGILRSGTAFINFCADYRKCPFSVAVFERDLDKVGNIQMFEGRVLEVTGKVREYKGTPEIVVKSRDQFGGEAITPQIRK